MHACAFASVISTFETCIKKGNFISWPGIENINFKKVLINTEATIKRHLDQERKHLQSTKTQVDTNDIFPTKSENITNEVYHNIYKLGEDKNYMDLAGRFSYQSSTGNNYIYLSYHYDANAILLQPLKNKEADSIKEAWLANNTRVKPHRTSPKHYTLDNESSKP